MRFGVVGLELGWAAGQFDEDDRGVFSGRNWLGVPGTKDPVKTLAAKTDHAEAADLDGVAARDAVTKCC